MKDLFFKHVDHIIFEEHEIRSLQFVLVYYKCIVDDYGYPDGDVKSTYHKIMLIYDYKKKKKRNIWFSLASSCGWTGRFVTTADLA